MNYDKQWATIRLQIDFPDAENVWVVTLPVYDNMILTEKIDQARDWILTSLAESAGKMYRDRKAFGEGKLSA